MTTEERRALIKEIAKVGGGSDQLMELLKNLGDDIEAAEKAGGEVEPVPDGFETWADALASSKAETEAANQRYIDRFFDGDGNQNPHKEPDGDEGKPGPGDDDEDNKPREYADLFETESKEEK